MSSKFLLGAALAVALCGGAAQAAPAPFIAAAVADKARPEADVQRDADRKPAEMLAFAQVKPGQTVVDLLPGRGYFTRLFAKAVGPNGVVYSVYPPPPAPPSAAEAIAADANYQNVKAAQTPPANFAIPTKADLIWTSQNYHDLKNVPNLDILKFNKAVYDALKPGGLYVVVDHVANPDMANATSTVHRIDPAVVRREVEAAGFKFDGETTALHNPADDHTKAVFDPTLRGHTDQFAYRFRKPK